MKRAAVLLPLFLLIAYAAGSEPVERPAGLRLTKASADLRKRVPAGLLAALRSDAPIELFSLHPYTKEHDAEDWKEYGLDGKPTLHDYAILGSTTLKGDARTIAMQVLFDGIEASKGAVAECFEPRHGLRVRHGKRTYELVICFTCLSAHVYVDGKELEDSLLLLEFPRPTWNAIFRAARVPLPEA